LFGDRRLEYRCRRDFYPKSAGRRRSTIMRATLHDRAWNTYYGHWPRQKPPFNGHHLGPNAQGDTQEALASSAVRARASQSLRNGVQRRAKFAIQQKE